MPESTRAAFETFIALAGDSKSVAANLDTRGVLIFWSAEAAKSAACAMHAVNEAEDRTQLLN